VLAASRTLIVRTQALDHQAGADIGDLLSQILQPPGVMKLAFQDVFEALEVSAKNIAVTSLPPARAGHV